MTADALSGFLGVTQGGQLVAVPQDPTTGAPQPHGLADFLTLTQGGRLVPRGDLSVNSNNPSDSLSIQGGAVQIRGSDASWQVIYGQVLVSGVYSFVTTDVPAGGPYLHTVITIAGHRIEAIDQLWLDAKLVTLGGGGIHPGDPAWGSGVYTDLVFMSGNLGDPNQAVDANLLSQSAAIFPGVINTNFRQRGRAYVYLILQYNQTVFPNALPVIQFLVRGNNTIIDPRDGHTKYTNNAALCIANFLASSDYGARYVYPDNFDLTNLSEAANICDEDVTLITGGTQKRYTVNGVLDTSQTIQRQLEMLKTTIGGPIVYSGGKWRIYPGAWRAPAITLTEADFYSEVSIQVLDSLQDAYNGVTGTFLDPTPNADGTANWQPTDFPAVENHVYLAQDHGVKNYLDTTFPLTTSSAAAQRLAKILLERARQSITITLTASLRAWQTLVGETIAVTWPVMGWIAKAFEVEENDLTIDQDDNSNPRLAVSLRLRETASGVFAWNDGEETLIDVAPNTTLPSPNQVQVPTGLTLASGTAYLYIRKDGTIFSRIYATWNLPSDPYVLSSGRFQIQYKKSMDLVWVDAPTVLGSTNYTYLLDVKDGDLYDVRVRSQNGLGFVSAWDTVTGHQVLGKSVPPANVLSFLATVQSFGILFTWDSVPDIDLSAYELRLGSTWDTAAFIDRTKATSYLWKVQTAGTYNVLIRALDTSGNYSALSAVVSVTIAGPAAPSSSFDLHDDLVYLTWGVPSSSQFAIDAYQITYGPTYAGSTPVSSTKALFYPVKPNWSGLRRFWIAAVDVAGNVGAANSLDVNIVPPSIVQNLRAQVIDNQAILSFDTPATHTLGVDHFNVYKGSTFGGATLLFEVAGTFAIIPETAGGTFTYWVAAVDTAGNIGTERAISASVTNPPGYILVNEADLLPAGALSSSNCFALPDGFSFLAPVDATQHFDTHFSSHSWATPQAQITAGYPYLLQPNTGTGSITWKVDLGSTLGSGLINFSAVAAVVTGSPTVVPTIRYSADDITYTTAAGVYVTLAQNFRYVKFTLDIGSAADTDLIQVSHAHYKIDVKTIDEVGTGSAVSTDASGTPYTMQNAFVSVTSVKVTPANQGFPIATDYRVPAGANPTQVFVYMWNTNTGARASGAFSITVSGVVQL